MGSDSVSVLGLGAMGAAMARAFLRAGHRVTVWNRSSGRISELVAQGAIAASGPAEAIAASALSVMCVLDYRAADQIIAAQGVTDEIPGRTLVQFSTGTPEQVAAQRDWVHAHAGHFIAAAIMGFPASVGREETLLVYAGDPVFAQHRPVLEALGKSLQYLGEDAISAVVANFALVAYHMGSMCLFYESAAAARAYGIDVTNYFALLQRTLDGLAQGIAGRAARIGSRDYDSQDPASAGATVEVIQLGLIDVVRTFRGLGLAPTMTEAALQYTQRAIDRGHASKDFAYLVECAGAESMASKLT